MGTSNKVVLIVDDDNYFRESLGDIIRVWDFNVLAVSGGKEALEILKEKPVDIVIMDIVMPEMNGIECLKLILQHHPDVRVIMMTAYHSEMSKAIDIGATKILSKPLLLEQLKLLLEEA